MTEGACIDISTLANLKGISVRGARKWALKNARTRYADGARGGGRNGKVLEVLLESLPEDIRRKYFSNINKGRTARVFRRGGPFISSPVESSPEPAHDNIVPLKKKAAKQTSIEVNERASSDLSPKAEKIALARVDLIHNVRQVKKDAKESGELKTKAAKRIMMLYNNGYLWHDIFEALGNVDLKTVYKWDKTLRAAQNDYAALAPRYGHNRGRFNLTDIERETFLKILLQPNRPTIGSATRIAKAILADKGIVSKASDATFRRFAEAYKEDNNHIWVLARQGEKALDDKVLPYIERDASLLEVGDVLVADGHPLNFQVFNPWTGKPCRAVLVLYLDWASRYPCGFEVMLTETSQCIMSAFRRAVINLGKVPRHALIDNGRAFKAKVFTSDIDLEQAGIYGLYSRLGVKVRFSAPYNAKDKPVERFFRTFNEWIERQIPSYVGAGIDDKPAYMQRNEKFHKAMHNPVVPTIEQAIKLIQAGIDFYAEQPHSGLKGGTPFDAFKAGKGPGVETENLNHLMMSMEIKKLYRNGIRMFGGHYWNEALVGYKGAVIAKYDFQDITKIFVYDTQGNYLGPAERTYKFDPLMRGTDMAALKKRQGVKRQIKSDTKRLVRAVHGRTEDLPEIEWQSVVESVPELPEVIEAAASDIEVEKHDRTESTVSIENVTEPIFTEGYERYEYLLDMETLTEDERRWIDDYRAGRICPGEYESIYGRRAATGGQQ